MAKYTVKVGFTDKYEYCTYAVGEVVEFLREEQRKLN